MAKENKWIAWVAVIALILAVVALAVMINTNMTGNATKVGGSLLVPLTEGTTVGSFPFNGYMYSMSLDYIDSKNCVKVWIKKSFGEGVSPMICEGKTVSFNGLRLSIDYIDSSRKVIIRMQ